MSTLARITRRSLDGYYGLLKVLLTTLMLLMILPVLMQILSRLPGFFPRYVWTEEAARFCFVWIIMIGSMIAVRDDSHFNVDLLPPPETPQQKGYGDLAVHMAMMLMALVFAGYGYDFARFGFMQNSEMSGINMLSIYISFPLAGVTWAIFLLERIVVDVQRILGIEPDPTEGSSAETEPSS
ncbi:MAG: TRAP transporter small permease [Planctomycetes bacterium]|nr:TRAP transporter small permease [Planctomycetota bacterium]